MTRPEWQPPKNERNRLLEALVLAFVVHLFALPAVLERIEHPPAREAEPVAKKPVRFVAIPSKASKNTRVKAPKLAAQKPETKPAPKPEEKVPPPDNNLKGQVVDVPPSPDSRVPEDAKYLAEHNSRTERETKSRHQSGDYQNSMNERSTAQRGEMASPNAAKNPAAIEVGPETPEQKATQDAKSGGHRLELPNVRAKDRLALKMDPSLGRFKNQERTDPLKGNSNRLKIAPGEAGQPDVPGSAPARAPKLAELIPPVGVLARLNGGPTNDHLQDLEEGEGTFLNTREFKYASFFNRLKRDINQHWRPMDEYRRRDPSGNIYGHRSRVTILMITLKADGSLKGVQVAQSSGVDFLDREAVQAFQRAEPFPNPPKGLVDVGSGEISFSFGFHLDFSQGIRMPF